MFTRLSLGFAFLLAAPVWCQVEAKPADTTSPSEVTESPMETPPPVSTQGYATVTASEIHRNYLHTGVVVSTAYTDNVRPDTSAVPVGDISYSISPRIMLDRSTPRLHQTFTYHPGFTYYERVSTLNEVDQNLSAEFQYRMSPHLILSGQDALLKSSNAFDQLNSAEISGSGQTQGAAVLLPIANQLTNTLSAGASYQFGRNDMFGASGTYGILHYLDSKQATGLYNSSQRRGGAFYTHRLSTARYVGLSYQYLQMLATPLDAQETGEGNTETNTAFVFYTLDLRRDLTLSVLAGPEFYRISQAGASGPESVTPFAAVSGGWQRQHASLAASFSRSVTGGGGLLGAFQSRDANGSFRWQLARAWTLGMTSGYGITRTVGSSPVTSNPGGHSIFGGVTADYLLGEHLKIGMSYTRLHQSYGSIAAIANTPDSDRAVISLSYEIARPLGR